MTERRFVLRATFVTLAMGGSVIALTDRSDRQLTSLTELFKENVTKYPISQ